MLHVILATAEALVHPCVNDVERDRRMHLNAWMQSWRWVPALIANASNKLRLRARRLLLIANQRPSKPRTVQSMAFCKTLVTAALSTFVGAVAAQSVS